VIFGWDRGLIRRGSTLSVFNSRLAPVTLRQTGDSPWWDEDLHLVMGPSGILATDGGMRFWVGVPTGG
jgi:hypothetical protein